MSQHRLHNQHPKLQSQSISQNLSIGEIRTSNTRKTNVSWMLLKMSIWWSITQDKVFFTLCFFQKFKNLFISTWKKVIKSEIMGVLKMRCFLSGMPDLKLGLNDKVLFENLGRDVAKVSKNLSSFFSIFFSKFWNFLRL